MKHNNVMGYKSWCFTVALLFGAASAEAGVNLHNVPLQTGSSVAPNVTFIIDDSGSMRWGFMPDELVNRLVTSGDRNLADCNQVVSFGGYTNLCAYNMAGRRYLTSSHLNKSYFNPEITYLPPVKTDGTFSPNSSFSNAWINGYKDTSTKVNLMSQYRALMDDFHYLGRDGDNWRSGFTVSPGANVGQAFYHIYSAACGDVYNDSCYTRFFVDTDQQTNFANWFSYYRTRLMASKAGIGTAFQRQTDGMRVGYGAINTSPVIASGVRKFNTTNKASFLDWLYKTDATGSTPLRSALDAAGQYYSSASPWFESPETNSGDIWSCRQSFTILMTDGYWKGDALSGIGNQDGTSGSNILMPDGTVYKYEPKAPFTDSYSNTLADVAMKYWKKDLRRDLDNNVPKSSENPAFWQHMITYGVGLGVDGTVSPAAAFDATDTGATITWPDPTSSQPGKIDDLLHAAVNSRGGFFSAADPDTFANELARTLSKIVARVASASNLVGATSSLETDKQIFQGRFFSGDWSGDLWGYDVSDSKTPSWKAADLLDARDWATRKIFYSTPTSTVKGAAFSGIAVPGLTEAQVNYLRGDRSKELNKPGGIFRIRNSVLGDIAHSAPFYVGEPENRFYERFSEWNATERTSYSSFLTVNKGRAKVVYVGSNSGMLHAFNSVTGQEEFAFIPNNTLEKLPALTSKDYQHQYYVDGSVTVSDAYVSSSWRSVLVGTSGRGGKTVFALDVTQPGSFNTSRVMWEKSIPELGNYTGKPVIAKLRDEKWYAILGSGVNSSNQGASLILIPLDGGEHRVITAEAGTAGEPNGLFQPEGWDIDNSGMLGRVFAGDLRGNIWEFDLTNTSPSSWVVAYSGSPLFVATDASGVKQSVTGGISVSMDAKSGNLWIFFGTGKYLEQTDPVTTQTQSWYGLVLPVTEDSKGKGKGKDLIEEVGPISGRSQLAKRTLTNVENARVVSETESLGGKRGWYIDLIDSGERIVSTPQVIGNALVVNTMVPKSDQCSPEGFGYVMAIDPFEGTRLKRNFFDIDGSKLIDDGDLVNFGGDKVPASGMRFDSAPGEPIFYKDTMKVGLENADIIDVVVDTEARVGRVSWREVIN